MNYQEEGKWKIIVVEERRAMDENHAREQRERAIFFLLLRSWVSIITSHQITNNTNRPNDIKL
jgi:hypothetical protein